MVPVIALATLVSVLHAAPALPSFDASLNQLRRDVLAIREAQTKEAEFKRIDGNIRLVGGQCYQLRGRIGTLRVEARNQQPGQSDPTLFSQLQSLITDMDVTARNSEVVRKQVEALLASAAKDPALVALAEKLYKDSRYLDSDAGYLLIEARGGNADFSVAGYGGQAYQIERLARYTAARTPDIRENAKKILEKTK